jgi:hypothetical protein
VTDREVVLGTGNAPGPKRGRVREFVANRSHPTKLGVLGVLLVLLTAPFGGLESAAEEDTRPLKLNQRIDIGPFYVTLESVTQLSDLQPAVSPEIEGAKLLVLKVKVTNHTDRAETSTLVRDAVGGEHTGFVPWSDDQGEIVPHVFNIDDATAFNEYINPGQTYTLALILQQEPDTDLDEVTFKIYGYYFREVDPQTLSPNTWVADETPLVEGRVPIEVKP